MPRYPRVVPDTGGDALVGSFGLDPSLARYFRNFYAGGYESRRRRTGFRILRAVSATAIGPLDGVEFLFTASGTERWFYKQNDSLYYDDGSATGVISTGWLNGVPATFFGMGEYLVVYTGGKRVVLRMPVATVIEENFDLAAPATGGVAVASSATAGGLVAGNVHQVYIVNLNQNTGRRSGPIGPFTVTIAAGQTSYDINTMPATPADAQFTHFEVYRTQANLSVPFLSKTLAVSVAGTLQNDGVADAALTFSRPLPQSAFGDYFVGVPPGTTNRMACVYRNMILTFAYRATMYHTEPGSNHRFSALYKVELPVTGFDVTAVYAGRKEVIAATEKEVFSITGTGVYAGTPPVADWQVETLTDQGGVFNKKCLLNVGGTIYGLGAGGVFAIDGGGLRPMKKIIRPDRMRTADAYFSPSTVGGNVASLGYHPDSRTLWASIPLKDAANSVQAPKSVVAVYPIDETGTVSYFDMQIGSFFKGGGRRSFIAGGTDHGRALLAGDSYGNVLELNFGENDGMADTTAYTVASVAGGSPTTLCTVTSVTPPAVLPARGVRIVGLPVDYTADPVVGTVVSNSSPTFDVADWGAAAAAGTIYYLGGLLGWYETGGLIFEGHEDGGFGEYVFDKLRLYLQDLVFDESDRLTASNQPHVIAQIKAEGGNWGPYVTVYDGTAFPKPGKIAAQLTGKVEAAGNSMKGVYFRIRLLVVVGNRPARIFAVEPSVGEAGLPKGSTTP